VSGCKIVLQIHILNSHDVLDDVSDEHVERFEPEIPDVEARLGQNECQNID
jgi:hypothetical protein